MGSAGQEGPLSSDHCALASSFGATAKRPTENANATPAASRPGATSVPTRGEGCTRQAPAPAGQDALDLGVAELHVVPAPVEQPRAPRAR